MLSLPVRGSEAHSPQLPLVLGGGREATRLRANWGAALESLGQGCLWQEQLQDTHTPVTEIYMYIIYNNI